MPTDAEPGPRRPEHQALATHACAACGAQAEWNPARQVLACPYCGTVAPVDLDRTTGEIREIDLVKTLREMPDELRGWQTETRTVRCQRCQAISVFDPGRVGQNCEFCGSPELVAYEEIKAPLRPQSVLPFAIDETRVRESVRRWYGGKWLAPSTFAKNAMVDTLHGLYILPWGDLRAHCQRLHRRHGREVSEERLEDCRTGAAGDRSDPGAGLGLRVRILLEMPSGSLFQRVSRLDRKLSSPTGPGRSQACAVRRTTARHPRRSA